ncbi:hypothetical protein QJS04_geneDACA017070 [Acorus gramineus]|uniref:Uncharacterized protein n=1 Tax=Acorus gramineus TaxID=55184 RepID=A0AAV9AM39_ACOGR|nr:hypothetical protein QJS04_geneDACA017070 [Acorus gramineus]
MESQDHDHLSGGGHDHRWGDDVMTDVIIVGVAVVGATLADTHEQIWKLDLESIGVCSSCEV